jgi:hypothetical protein
MSSPIVFEGKIIDDKLSTDKLFDIHYKITRRLTWFGGRGGFSGREALIADIHRLIKDKSNGIPIGPRRSARLAAKPPVNYVENNDDNGYSYKYDKKVRDMMIKYCAKHNITFHYTLADKFLKWHEDPANKALITRTYTRYSEWPVGAPYPTGPEVTETYPLPLSRCIHKWMATLKKTIVD